MNFSKRQATLLLMAVQESLFTLWIVKDRAIAGGEPSEVIKAQDDIIDSLVLCSILEEEIRKHDNQEKGIQTTEAKSGNIDDSPTERKNPCYGCIERKKRVRGV